jgi:hypothetical protein
VRRALFAALLAAACAQPRTQAPGIGAGESWTTGDWPIALAIAQQAALEGRFGDADHELATFANRAYGTPPAAETRYWRALFLVDPANPERDPDAALEHLDAYLHERDGALPHYAEALVLRRVAMTLDSLGTARRLAARADSTAASDSTRTRETELARQNQQLREQLERTNAELERIKKRMAERP